PPPSTPFSTLSLHDALPISGARRFVYASSAAVYGDPKRLPVSEADATRPISEYGASKLAFEHYLDAHGSHGLIEYAVLRYANVRSEEHTSELQSRSDLVCRL